MAYGCCKKVRMTRLENLSDARGKRLQRSKRIELRAALTPFIPLGRACVWHSLALLVLRSASKASNASSACGTL